MTEAVVKEADEKISDLEWGGDIFLTCAACGLKLLYIIIVKPTEELHRLKAHCPCGDYSFVKDVKGKLNMAAMEGLVISDCDLEYPKYKEKRDQNKVINVYLTKES